MMRKAYRAGNCNSGGDRLIRSFKLDECELKMEYNELVTVNVDQIRTHRAGFNLEGIVIVRLPLPNRRSFVKSSDFPEDNVDAVLCWRGLRARSKVMNDDADRNRLVVFVYPKINFRIHRHSARFCGG